MKRRSIGERLGRGKSLEARRATALDWASRWRADHDGTLHELERAIGRGDMAAAGQLVGQIKALNAKAMSALPRVIEALADDDVL